MSNALISYHQLLRKTRRVRVLIRLGIFMIITLSLLGLTAGTSMIAFGYEQLRGGDELSTWLALAMILSGLATAGVCANLLIKIFRDRW